MSDLVSQVSQLVQTTNTLIAQFGSWNIVNITNRLLTLETKTSSLENDDVILNNKIINLASRVDALEGDGGGTPTLPTPTLSGADTVQEGTSVQNTITNYDSTVTYTVTSSDTNVATVSISNDTITVTGEDITDGQNHQVTITVLASKTGYASSQVQKAFTVTVITFTEDQEVILLEGTTFTEDSFVEVEDGYVA